MNISTRMQKLFAYNRWAWEHVFQSVATISQEAYKEQRPFFWHSLHGTLVHALTAEFIWLERCSGRSPKKLFTRDDFADFAAVEQRWQQVNTDWDAFLAGLDEADYGRTIHYTTTEGTNKAAVMADIIQHMINHSTEHRSQITPILAQLGRPTAELDYIYYCLELTGQ